MKKTLEERYLIGELEDYGYFTKTLKLDRERKQQIKKIKEDIKKLNEKYSYAVTKEFKKELNTSLSVIAEDADLVNMVADIIYEVFEDIGLEYKISLYFHTKLEKLQQE